MKNLLVQNIKDSLKEAINTTKCKAFTQQCKRNMLVDTYNHIQRDLHKIYEMLINEIEGVK